MIRPGSPAPLVKNALVSFLGVRARVVRDVPNTWKPADGAIVLVADDGGPLQWPVLSKNIVRITVLGNGMDPVRELAEDCMGHIFEDIPTGLSHIKRDGTTILEARDPKTGADMASFTVTATVRTTNTV